MGQYLVDSNAMIDFWGNLLPPSGATFMEDILPAIATITRIEILSWRNATLGNLQRLEALLLEVLQYPLDENIIKATIKLRQEYKIKTPDAIIAATALVHKLVLITRNTNDFDKIATLKLINPYNL